MFLFYTFEIDTRFIFYISLAYELPSMSWKLDNVFLRRNVFKYLQDIKLPSFTFYLFWWQEEEVADITNLFNRGKKKKKRDKTAAEIALLVEEVMAELEFVAEEDALLNLESKPAINKLMKLPFLTEVLSK